MLVKESGYPAANVSFYLGPEPVIGFARALDVLRFCRKTLALILC